MVNTTTTLQDDQLEVIKRITANDDNLVEMVRNGNGKAINLVIHLAQCGDNPSGYAIDTLWFDYIQYAAQFDYDGEFIAATNAQKGQ